jgi:predicted nucleic acid-binding Zn ribbon protein
MEDYTAEMIRDMAFSFCPQCGTAIVPNHKGRPRKFCSPECRSRWNNTHPKPENWKTVRSKICPVCGREFAYDDEGISGTSLEHRTL